MRYYQLQRQQEASAAAGNAGRVTVRALESSLRLAEAHAKLMFHSAVTFEVS
jgi:DNA replicative helicase MCM subunit Mcm2 (Cdc46/Mcm family)